MRYTPDFDNLGRGSEHVEMSTLTREQQLMERIAELESEVQERQADLKPSVHRF